MNFTILKIKTIHIIENGRTVAAVLLSSFGLKQLSKWLKPQRQQDIEQTISNMTPAEVRNFERAKGQGKVAIYRMYEEKYKNDKPK